MADEGQRGVQAMDRRIVEAWIDDNPASDARLIEVSDSDDQSWRSLRPHGSVSSGEPFFIVSVPDHDEMIRARTELLALVANPENLRVRRWKPSRAEIDRFQSWIWNNNRPFGGPQARVTMTGPHPRSGLLMISLSSVDRQYAEELEEAADGLAYVLPKPERIVPLRRR